MKYAIKVNGPLTSDSFAIVYRPWPFPAKTRCNIGWTPYYWDATQFDTVEEAKLFVAEIKSSPSKIVNIVGL